MNDIFEEDVSFGPKIGYHARTADIAQVSAQVQGNAHVMEARLVRATAA